MTSQILEELLVRRAGPQDYHAVLAISQNVYDGFDYLPRLYHVLLQDKKTNTMYVEELNGEIVSLKDNLVNSPPGATCLTRADPGSQKVTENDGLFTLRGNGTKSNGS